MDKTVTLKEINLKIDEINKSLDKLIVGIRKDSILFKLKEDSKILSDLVTQIDKTWSKKEKAEVGLEKLMYYSDSIKTKVNMLQST